MARSLALLMLTGLVACDLAQPDNEAADAPDLVAPANRAAPAAQAERPAVALDGEGLRLIDGETGAARPLNFGVPMAQTVEILAAAFGRPPDESTANDECPGGPLAFAKWEDRLQLVFQDGRFVGWDSPAGLTTMNGIGIGSTRAALEQAYEVEAAESSVGTEFSGGGLGGLLDSAEPDARVAALWAGTTCIFR